MTAQWLETVRETDLAYMAGLMDGEGTIGITRRSGGPTYKSLRYTLVVAVQMSDRPSIDHVAALFQRSVYEKGPYANMRKTAYLLQWQARVAAELLEPLVPYLVLKRPQAEIALQFQREQDVIRRGVVLSDEILARKEFCYQELRRLKRES